MKKATKKRSRATPKTTKKVAKKTVKSAKTSKVVAKSRAKTTPVKSAAKSPKRVAKKPAAKKTPAPARAPRKASPASGKSRSKTDASSKTSKASTSRATGTQDSVTQATQQIWLAGLGALSSAREQGEQLLEDLIKQGSDVERAAREFAERSGKALGKSGARTSQHAGKAWDRLQEAFEERVADLMTRLGVPARHEMDLLMRHVKELTRQVERLRNNSLTRLNRLTDAGTRRTRDDLSDLARELEEVQLAAKRSMKQGIAQIKKAIKDAAR